MVLENAVVLTGALYAVSYFGIQFKPTMGTEENCLWMLLSQKKEICWGKSFVRRWAEWQYNTEKTWRHREETLRLTKEGFFLVHFRTQRPFIKCLCAGFVSVRALWCVHPFVISCFFLFFFSKFEYRAPIWPSGEQRKREAACDDDSNTCNQPRSLYCVYSHWFMHFREFLQWKTKWGNPKSFKSAGPGYGGGVVWVIWWP